MGHQYDPNVPGRVLLHVGVHKTGTTSIQLFLHDQGDLLATVGACRPTGFLLPQLHAELPLLTLRRDWSYPARLRLPETDAPAWRAAASAHLRAQVASEPELLVFSHEDLSYLRHDDEFERLADLLAPRSVTVVVFVRDRTGFLSSYREQLRATGFEPSDDPASFAYVEPDSWLADFDALMGGYRARFGDANVVVVDYDAVMQRDETVIPAFTDLLGIPRTSLPPLDGYFANQSGSQARLTPEQLEAVRRLVVEQAK
jgi:hypothetical protein